MKLPLILIKLSSGSQPKTEGNIDPTLTRALYRSLQHIELSRDLFACCGRKFSPACISSRVLLLLNSKGTPGGGCLREATYWFDWLWEMLWTLEDRLAFICCPESFVGVLQESKVYIITSLHTHSCGNGWRQSTSLPLYLGRMSSAAFPPLARQACGIVSERTHRGKTYGPEHHTAFCSNGQIVDL